MLGYDAWCIPSAAYLAVGRALLAAKFAEFLFWEVAEMLASAANRRRLLQRWMWKTVHVYGFLPKLMAAYAS